MLVDIDAANKAALDIIRIGEEIKPTVGENDLVGKFLLTLHAYHRGESVDINYWLNGLKSDGTRIRATVFQAVKIVDNNHNLLGYVPPLMVDPTGILPPEVRENLHDLLQRVEKLESNIPGQGRAFMRKNIIDHVVGKTEQKEQLRVLWDSLFVKYGLAPVYSENVSDAMDVGHDDDLKDGEFDVEYL